MHISRLAIITNRGVKMTAKLAMSRFWLMASGYFHSFTFIQVLLCNSLDPCIILHYMYIFLLSCFSHARHSTMPNVCVMLWRGWGRTSTASLKSCALVPTRKSQR